MVGPSVWISFSLSIFDQMAKNVRNYFAFIPVLENIFKTEDGPQWELSRGELGLDTEAVEMRRCKPNKSLTPFVLLLTGPLVT